MKITAARAEADTIGNVRKRKFNRSYEVKKMHSLQGRLVASTQQADQRISA